MNLTRAAVWGGIFVLLVVLLAYGKERFASHEVVSSEQPDPLVQSGSAASKGIQPLVFFEKDHFYEGVLYAKEHVRTNESRIVGGIVPHHLLPSFIIADFFSRITIQKPSTIIVIGPNHYEAGEHQVLSSDFDWQTPFGVVSPHYGIIEELKERKLLDIDNKVATNEHSVAGMMPYIKYYLPDAIVVPLMIKRSLSMEEINTLATELSKYSEKGAVVVASVDFSHYLNANEAEQKDSVTLQAMRDFDYRRLLTLSNDYLDSPPSIAVLLSTMQKRGISTSELAHHTNSGILQHDPFQETTSYISLVFHR